jgi:hypothetical protein
MSRTALWSSSLFAVLAIAATVALAAAPRTEPATESGRGAMAAPEQSWSDDDGPGRDGPWHRGHRDGRRGMMGRGGMGRGQMAFAAAKDPSAAVLLDLRALERMYRASGREKDVAGLYRDALARSKDPVVRHLAGRRLARLEWQAGDKQAALEQMQRNLDEDLKRLK